MYKIKKSNCKHLRSKMSHIPDQNNSERWRSSDSKTAQYWCLKTMMSAGPDSGLVAPNECQEQRICYVDKNRIDE
jgi:hypothetical protein